MHLILNITVSAKLLWFVMVLLVLISTGALYLYLKLKKERKEVQKKISEILEFNTTLSHELRTPLYAVTNISKNLLESNPKKEQLEDLQILERASNYLVKLINDSLILRKIDAERLSYHQEDFELDRLLQQVMNTVQKQVTTQDGQIALVIDSSVPNHLVGDPVKLTQILINLLNNAVKFGEGKPVLLKISSKKIKTKRERILFEIIDHGKGISEKEKPKIMEYFYQMNTTNHSFGSGLGLPIVVKLLKILDSTLSLSSKEGSGSVFSFELDFKTENYGKNNIETLNIDHLKTLSVLVVDDNLINQALTVKTLNKIGVRAMPCHSGNKAITLVKSKSFDMVLMDLYMPVMSGEEATKRIRGFDQNIPIIALTAVDKFNHWEELSKIGFTSMLHKPYEESELHKVMMDAYPSAKAL